ncbi:hypothetical protein OQA88_4440 [Cercophora sp. LCS_1]
MSPLAVEAVPQTVGIKAKTLTETPAQTEVVEPESLEMKPIVPESKPAEATNGSNGANGTTPEATQNALPQGHEGHREPLKLSGAFDQFTSFDVTPVIGRKFVGVDLVKWLRAANLDEFLCDFAITIFQYSIVVFCA